jgi:hypothetical protein
MAQLKFGLRAGVSSSSIKMNDIMTKTKAGLDSIAVTAGNAKVGFHFGVVGRLELLSVFIQPELLLSSTGGEVKVNDVINKTESIKDQKFTRVDIPIMIGKSFGPARVELGPIASFILSSKSGIEGLVASSKEDFKKASWGYQVGLGLDVWKLALDLKYEGNFSKLGKDVTLFGKSYTTDTRNSQWVMSLAFFF